MPESELKQSGYSSSSSCGGPESKLRKDRGQRWKTIPILIKTPIIGFGGEGDTERLNADLGRQPLLINKGSNIELVVFI